MWKIVGENGAELIQCSFEESRISVRAGPATGFMTKTNEPPEAPITMPTRDLAEGLAAILRQTSIEQFRNAKVIRA